MALGFYSGYDILHFIGRFCYFIGFLHKFGNGKMVLASGLFYVFCALSRNGWPDSDVFV